MKWLTRPVRVLSIVLLAVTCTAVAQTNTNIVNEFWLEARSLERITEKIVPYLEQRPAYDASLEDRLTWQVERNARKAGAARLGYPSHLGLARAQLNDGYDSDYIVSRGKGIYSRTLLDSLRIVAVDSFQIDFERRRRKDNTASVVGTRFIEGTLGGTLEEHRPAADSATPDESQTLREWLRSFDPYNRVHFGVQIFDENPYLYMSTAIRQRRDGTALLLSNTRLHSELLDDDTGIPRIKQEFTRQLKSSAQLSFGFSCYPTKVGNEGLDPRFSLRYLHEFRKGDMIYASASTNQRETMLIAGVSLTRLFNR